MRPPRYPAWRRLSGGFTLLELVVVIVVIGVLVSIFTLSFGSFTEDTTDEHARRLEALLTLAFEEAGIQGRELGIRFYQHGYEFSVRDSYLDKNGNQAWAWLPLDNDQLLKPRDLGEEIRVELEIEGREIILEFERSTDIFADENEADTDQEVDAGEAQRYRPHAFLLSSGDVEPPFQVRIRPAFASKGIVLDVKPEGTVEVTPDEY
ncbi:MAG: prepilin-type N-terminal cleavage/methylation domain-containing protein [Gammaproteobacteria bacterium]|jgi:general secretion pathway protein H|nr:prepilin-type N-terminal cleavage/methylation domain-containing protein [Gammaproteobacteria bacterium]MDP6617674.1 prepilin-type N-terminal cleavage/methylation domain-containing protein [Gammaproteobacteria bacterium]MDP6694971.1 prepilin-type N-terminal cleavage/methylation domain-containing protein [Gammaproteobacteria bacterium]